MSDRSSRLFKALAAADAEYERRLHPQVHDAPAPEASPLREYHSCTRCHLLFHQDQGVLFRDKGRPIFTCSSCAPERRRHEQKVSPLEKKVMGVLASSGYQWEHQFELLDERGVLKGLVDFVIPDLHLALECGSLHHKDPRRRARDEMKKKMLQAQGYVVRYVTTGDTVAQVDAAILFAEGCLARRAEEKAEACWLEELEKLRKEATRRADENWARLHPPCAVSEDARKRLSATSERMRKIREYIAGTNVPPDHRHHFSSASLDARERMFADLLDQVDQIERNTSAGRP